MTRNLLAEFLMLAGLVIVVVGLWTFSRALGLIAGGALLTFLGAQFVQVTVRRPSTGG